MHCKLSSKSASLIRFDGKRVDSIIVWIKSRPPVVWIWSVVNANAEQNEVITS